jgi:hypothetical protein
VKYLLSLVFIIASCWVSSHTNTLTYKNFIQNSEIIVLGEVIEQTSYWDNKGKNIYTNSTIKVDSVIRGNAGSELRIITEGGIVENVWQKVSTSPELNLHDKGFFILNKIRDVKSTIQDISESYSLLAGERGFIPVTNSRNFKFKNSSHHEFFHELEKITGYKSFIFDTGLHIKSANAQLAIVKLSPLELTAGTGEILSIYGSGFGTQQDKGEVWFKYANDGNSIFTHPDFRISLWSDTLIRIEVPSEASTGKVTIKKEGKDIASSDILTVKYAHVNYNFQPIVLIDRDNFGGYSWYIHNSLNFHPMAAQTVEKCIGKWICATSVPWRIAGYTSESPGMDNKCTIYADSLDGILGKTSAFFERATTSSGKVVWVLLEADITIDIHQTYCFSRENIQNDEIDFETVVLHELAHAKLFGHVNDTDDLMYFGLKKGRYKSIGTDNIACSHHILTKSTEQKARKFDAIQPIQPDLLGMPGEITGVGYICYSLMESEYSIPIIDNASGYQWEIIPYDAGTLQSQDNSVTIIWNKNYSGEASLSACAENYCGSLGFKSNRVITISSMFAYEENIFLCRGESYNGWSEEGAFLETFISDDGCDSVVTTILSVSELPAVPEILINYDTLSSAGSYAAYQWYNEDGLIQGADSKQYVALHEGTYYLEALNENGCSNVSEPVYLMKTSVHASEIQPWKISLFPNPNQGVFILKISTSYPENLSVRIINQTGISLFYQEINNPVFYRQIDLSGYSKGIFYLLISGNKKSASQKIIIH